MVVIAAGRDEGGLLAVALHQLEAEHAGVEAERAVEIGDLEMDMADPHAGIDGARGFGKGLKLGRHGRCPCWLVRPRQVVLIC